MKFAGSHLDLYLVDCERLNSDIKQECEKLKKPLHVVFAERLDINPSVIHHSKARYIRSCALDCSKIESKDYGCIAKKHYNDILKAFGFKDVYKIIPEDMEEPKNDVPVENVTAKNIDAETTVIDYTKKLDELEKSIHTIGNLLIQLVEYANDIRQNTSEAFINKTRIENITNQRNGVRR